MVEEIKKKRGPKSLKGEPMTGVERNRRMLAKTKCYATAAKENGYKIYPVLICDKQLETLAKFYCLESHGLRETRGNGSKIDSSKLNDIIYHAMKMYLENFRLELINKGFPIDSVDFCNTVNYPADHNKLCQIEINSAELFKQWELSQTNLKEPQ